MLARAARVAEASDEEPGPPIAIVRYVLFLGGPTSERWRRMMQYAEAALRPED
jgi:hypothetical protein